MEEKNKPHDWAEKDWNRATHMKLYNGTRPRDALTREESAIVICRAIDYVMKELQQIYSLI